MRAQHDDMVAPPSGEVSSLLRAWSAGDGGALDRLTPIVYEELRRLARRYMKGERPGHSLQTTAPVNEAYLRLVDHKRMRWHQGLALPRNDPRSRPWILSDGDKSMICCSRR